MLIRVNKNWKDLAEFCPDQAKNRGKISRRELIKGTAAASLLSVMLPEDVIRNLANAETPVCPAPVRQLGAIGQIFAEGGSTVSARFISDAQVAAMTAGMADNYGVSCQANYVKLGPNVNIDQTTPFGFALLQGPPGY